MNHDLKFEPISSKDNPLFKEIRLLQATGSKGQKARIASGHALLEGIHLVQTWVGDPALKTLLTSEVGLGNSEISHALYSTSRFVQQLGCFSWIRGYGIY